MESDDIGRLSSLTTDLITTQNKEQQRHFLREYSSILGDQRV